MGADLDAIPWAVVAVGAGEKPIVESCMAKSFIETSEMNADISLPAHNAAVIVAGAIFAAGHAEVHAMIMARGAVERVAVDQAGGPLRGQRCYAAKSATTASSTGNPDCVTRSRPLASTVMAPSSVSVAMRPGSSARPDSAL